MAEEEARHAEEPTEQAVPPEAQPDDAPQPVKKKGGCAPRAIVLVGVAAAGYALLSPALCTRTMGATRSARLQWERRQELIQQALNENADEQNDTEQQREQAAR